MSIRKTMLCVALAVLAAAVVANASQGWFTESMDMDLKILKLPENAGHGELSLVFRPSGSYGRFHCDEVEVEVVTKHGLVFLGTPKWTVPMDSSTVYSTVLNIDIPDNDTTGIWVHVKCWKLPQTGKIYFVTTGDTVETYGGHPRGRTPRPDSTWSQMERAKFTPEQLQKEFDFILDMRHSWKNQRVFAEKLLGELHPTDTPNVYLIRASIDNWVTLWGDWGMMIKSVDDSAFNAEFPQHPEDSLPRDGNPSDTLKSQSSLDKEPNPQNQGAITLERVAGLTGDNTLPINQTIT